MGIQSFVRRNRTSGAPENIGEARILRNIFAAGADGKSEGTTVLARSYSKDVCRLAHIAIHLEETVMLDRKLFTLAAMLAAFSCAATSDDDGSGGSAASGTSNPALVDSDGDTITDADEGAAFANDSDHDGTPDYLDHDSDGDGISDHIEAGDGDSATPPFDSDHDGVPDFRDIDSDGNLLLDAQEGSADTDHDGVPDFADPDNDGDQADDAFEVLAAGMDCDGDGQADMASADVTRGSAPADCDGDGVPNHLDVDSDGDSLRDMVEGVADSDGDGLFDRYEWDSDNDGFSDAEEAGDDDPLTPPIDSDGDLVPNYLDHDSDADGLSDYAEGVAGTDPTKQDSDGDGVTDLIEVAADTDPLDAADNPQINGDFVFVVPYQQPTTPTEDTLQFRTSVQYADVYFLFDRSGSMQAEFSAMKGPQGVPAIMDALRCKVYGASCVSDEDCGAGKVCFSHTVCIEDPLTANGGAGCIPNMWTGVGHFHDCNTYTNTLHLQPNPQLTAAAIGNAGVGYLESVVQSPGCVADPSLCLNDNGCSAYPGLNNPVACPGFRPSAVRLLVSITDADNQGGSCGGSVPSVATTGAALQSQGIKFIGLYGTGDDGAGSLCTSPQSCAEQLGIASGTLDENNQPFAYPALDAQVVPATKQGIMDLVRGVPLVVTIKAFDSGGDDGDALQFIDHLEINNSGQGACTNVSPTVDIDADGHKDTFPSLLAGTSVCWDVHPVAAQSSVPASEQPQLFKARLVVFGDASPLDSRYVYFLVPPVGTMIPQGPN